jgi:hypothetical protein|tara:strand:- start:80 stop:826 length:747 start_codon:yes stop_codon:yes gene_type:complete
MKVKQSKKVSWDSKKEFIELLKNSKSPIENKFKSFAKFIRRQDLARLIVIYEIFRKQINIKGSIIECGVNEGMSLMSMALLSSILEPYNYHRQIIGFDTFSGFPGFTKEDKPHSSDVKKSQHTFEPEFDTYEDLIKCINFYDKNRFLNNKKKIELIKGDASKTIPKYLKENKHLVVSLLFIDFDIYKPAKIALDNFLPLMPKGSIIVFDEINNPMWPGETKALLEKFNLNNYKIQCHEFDPNLSYLIL